MYISSNYSNIGLYDNNTDSTDEKNYKLYL